MEKDLLDKIYFKSRVDIEFIISINVLNTWTDTMKYIKNNSLFTDADSVSLFSSMHDKISDKFRKELAYIDRNIIWGIIAYLFVSVEYKSIEAFLSDIGNQDETPLLSYIVQSYLFNNVADEHAFREIENFRSDIGAMLSAVRKARFQKNSVKQRLIEILKNYKEFKQRLSGTLFAYYYEIYKAEEEKIAERQAASEEKYRSLFQKDPQHFMDLYLKYEDFSESWVYSIHVSYFAFSYYLFLSPDDTGNTLVILGCQADKNFLLEKADKDKLHNLFKILADKTRFDIICALNSRPHFTQELADKFSLAPSTVNYHLGAMLEFDIVTIGREHHRVYYTLKKDVFEELLVNSLKIMI